MSFYDKYVDWTYLHTDLPRCPHNINAPYDLWEMLDTDVLVPYPLYDTEILAPATASTYKDAVRAGADAVYFGYGKLNARATAENLDNFYEIVSFCHKYGAKAYLALNVMLKDTEIEDAKKIIAEAEKAKIDAFIISDLALVPIIKRMSGAAIHASTQIGIHNRAGAKFAYESGIDRVVLSRETTPNDICDILRNVDVEAEVFCHGALCTGFSGACLLSSMLTGKSGNRGRCAQLCRHRYSCYVNGEKADEGYLLSSKDICMASKFDELEDLCVNSLKIEGRLKNKNYVEGVTGAYVALKEGDSVFDEEISDKLKSYFNRGNFTRGYWDDSDIIYKGAPNHIGVRYGKVVKVISKNLVLISAKRKVVKDDCFKVVREGKDIGGIVATGETKFFEGKNCYVCYSPCESRINDLVFLTKTAVPFDEPRKILVEVAVRLVAGEPIKVKATCRNVAYEFFGDIVEKAKTEPITPHDVVTQFSRTGDTDFEFLILKVVVKDAFMTKKALNELRRKIIEFYENAFVNEYNRPPVKNSRRLKAREKIGGDFVQIDDVRQLSATLKVRFNNIVYSPLNYDIERCKEFYSSAKRDNNNVYVQFPIFIPAELEEKARLIIREFDGVVANNPGVYRIAEEEDKLVVAGWNMNVANTKNPLLKTSNQTVISVELNSAELKKFPDSLIYTYGRLTLMYLNFCPKRLVYGTCDKCKYAKDVALRDNKGEYPVITKKFFGYCQHELKNSVITNLGALVGSNPRYFDFCGMKSNEINQVLKSFYSENNPFVPTEYNHLHINRGVE